MEPTAVATDPSLLSLLLQMWAKGVQDGLWGAAVGIGLGLIGGIVGTYFAIRNARTPANRKVTIQFAIMLWSIQLLGLAALLLVPMSKLFVVMAGFGVGLCMCVIYYNKNLKTGGIR